MPTQFGGNWGQDAAQQQDNSFYTDSDSSDLSEEEERANLQDMDHEEDRQPSQLNSDSEHEVPLRPEELEERRRQVEAGDFNDDIDIDNVATI